MITLMLGKLCGVLGKGGVVLGRGDYTIERVASPISPTMSQSHEVAKRSRVLSTPLVWLSQSSSQTTQRKFWNIGMRIGKGRRTCLTFVESVIYRELIYMLITTRDLDLGLQECSLDLTELYPETKRRHIFEEKWRNFFASGPEHGSLFRRSGNLLIYRTESLVPIKVDSRPPVVLLFGNPASQSVQAGMCFAFEGLQKEHRIWGAFRRSGLLKFHANDSVDVPAPDRNRNRKRSFFDLQYDSDFRFAIAMFFSVPSPASIQRWAGVAGLNALFGTTALSKIASSERERVDALISAYIGDNRGGVIVFQRDAYEGIRSSDTTPYSIKGARNGLLQGKCEVKHDVPLAGMPPTRFAHGQRFSEHLVRCCDRFKTEFAHLALN